MLVFSLLEGRRVSSCRASAALRRRASMSEIGSLTMGSPARLGHTGQLAAQRHQAQADAAQPEVTVESTRAAAGLAAIDGPGRKLRGAVDLRPLTSTCHVSAPERHTEGGEELFCFLVGIGGSDERNVHALDLLDLVEVDLGEHDLLFEAERVVAGSVEAAWVHPAEVANARQRERDQAVQELPHA